MKIVLLHTPKIFAPILRRLLGSKKDKATR